MHFMHLRLNHIVYTWRIHELMIMPATIALQKITVCVVQHDGTTTICSTSWVAIQFLSEAATVKRPDGYCYDILYAVLCTLVCKFVAQCKGTYYLYSY